MLISLLLFLFGFILLLKGADWLVNGSASLARRYRISELTIGLTIVAFGTSSPELVVNTVAAVNGYNDVVMGNIVGSNLFNLLFILGLSALIYPVAVKVKTILYEIPFSLLAALLLLLLVNDKAVFNTDFNILRRPDAIILLLVFVIFLYYVFKNRKADPGELEVEGKEYGIMLTVVMIAGGLAALLLGGNLVVNNAVKLAKLMGISERVIGLTIISAGTSLPELATSVMAASKKRSDLAIGNVIGSNIFNILFILGVSAFISPVQITGTFNPDILLLILATLLVLLAMFTGGRKKLDRWEGGLFLGIFIAYILWLIF